MDKLSTIYSTRLEST